MKVDVAVAGGGLSALLAASFFAQKGLSTAQVGPLSSAPGQRLLAISPKNLFWLEKLGLPQKSFFPVQAMEITSSQGKTFCFNAKESRLPWLCAMIFEKDLTRSLALPPQVEHISSPVLDVFAREDMVEIAAGEKSIEARLLVAADGAHSFCRKLLGVESRAKDYGTTALVADLAPQKPAHATAFEWFSKKGILALLPHRQGVSTVFALPTPQARQLARDEKQFLEAVFSFSQGRLGRFSLLSSPEAYPLAQVVSRKLISSRVFFLGNAAHAIHPLAGYGFNLAMGDLQALDRHLYLQDPGDPACLARAARSRALANTLMSGFTHMVAQSLKESLGALAFEGAHRVAARFAFVRRAMVSWASQESFW